MDFFVKHAKATRDGVLVMLGFQLFLFVMGVVMVLVINATVNEDRDYAALGAMMSMIGTVFGGLLRGAGAPVRYRMAVSMGHTRRAYMIVDPIITALNSLIGVGFAVLLHKFELWLYSVLYAGWELDFDVFVIFELWMLPVFLVGVCAIDFCLGALQLRFGAKGFAMIWFPLCFAPMVVGNSVSAAREGSTSLLAQIGRGVLALAGLLPPPVWAALGLAVLLVMVVLSVMCYRKSEVKM